MTKRNLSELLDTTDPGIRVLRQWAGEAKMACELLAPSAEREAVLLDPQVTTRSTLGALAYDTGGMLIDGGWIRLLGSGHSAAFTSRSWTTPQDGQVHLRTASGSASHLCPHAEHVLLLAKKRSATTT